MEEPAQSETGHPLVLPEVQQLLVGSVAIQDIDVGKGQVLLHVFHGYSCFSCYHSDRGVLAEEGIGACAGEIQPYITIRDQNTIFGISPVPIIGPPVFITLGRPISPPPDALTVTITTS